MEKKTLAITGMSGFVGSHLWEHVMKTTNWDTVGIVKMDRAGDLNRIEETLQDHPEWRHRTKIVRHDLNDSLATVHKHIGEVDYIAHLAACSHVDTSIADPVGVFCNNARSTVQILEYARKYQPNLKKFLYFSCYDKKTRALTKDGLKSYDELKVGDIVFTIGKDGLLEEKPIKKVIIQDYDGDMVRLYNGKVNMMITPNHRMYNDKMEVFEADTLLEMPQYRGYKMPHSKGFIGTDKPVIVGDQTVNLHDLFYVSGVFVGDGFTAYQEKITENKSGLNRDEFISRRNERGQFYAGRTGNATETTSKSWRIFFDVPENDKARERLEESLTNLGISWAAQKGKSGEHVYITSKKWSEYFKQFGKHAKNKTIPDWMLDYSPEYLHDLYDGLIDSDGHYMKGSIDQYTTVSTKLSEKMCELAFKLGYFPRINKIYNESHKEDRKISGEALSIIIGKGGRSIKGGRIGTEYYKNKIWCITVENKNFITERDGVFSISGNTDEVYGPAPEGYDFTETDKLHPSNPYSAGKAAGEMITMAYGKTYGLPYLITNTMNIFGERQDPEKLIPKAMKMIAKGEPMTIHGMPGNVGKRHWLHARNAASAVIFLLNNPIVNDKVHIVGDTEIDNLEMFRMIAKTMGKKTIKEGVDYVHVNFHQTRPGHDSRYSMSGKKLADLGWKAPVEFEESLIKTIEWTQERPKWLDV